MVRSTSRLSLGLVAVALACALFAATAVAKTISGDDNDNNLVGTKGSDRIFAKGGNDVVRGLPGRDLIRGGTGNDRVFGDRGSDVLFGGDGNDRVHGNAGNDVSFGGNGNDFMSGGYGNDLQFGNAGDDTIFANRGHDVSYGGDGNDTLWALARGDRHGRHDLRGDRLYGGNGNDTFRTRDGERDVVNCGAGDDTVIADYKDAVANNCEHVTRAAVTAPSPTDESQENATANPPETP